MVIINELYNTVVFQMTSEELVIFLEDIKNKKEIDIELLKGKINTFERKKRMEEAYYQSLSTFRKIFASRPPSHHQVIEYLVNVKDRFTKIEEVKQRVFMLDRMISKVQTESNKEEIGLSIIIIEEIRKWQETEGN